MFLKLRDWIRPNKLFWGCTTSIAANDTEFLKQYIKKIDWTAVVKSCGDIDFIINNLDKISVYNMSYRFYDSIFIKRLSSYIHENIDKFDWHAISGCCSDVQFLRDNIDRLSWYWLSLNLNAVDLLLEHPDKVSWGILQQYNQPKCLTKEFMIELMSKYQFIVNDDIPFDLPCIVKPSEWYKTCASTTDIDFLRANKNKIDWSALSHNVYAIDLLKENKKKIDWSALSHNPAIFTYEYDTIRETLSSKNACVIEWFNHPRFLQKYLLSHDTIDGFDEWLLDGFDYLD